MAIFAVSDEGVEGLSNVINQLQEGKEQIMSIATSLRGEVDSHDNVIGPHQKQIEEIFDIIKTNVDNAASPIDDLCNKINELINKYQEIIDLGIDVDA